MIAKLLQRARSSSVARNTTSLFVVQIATFLIPIILTPYLARTLGLETFGVLALATGVAAYVGLILDWGFPLSGPQDVAMNRDDGERIIRIFWDTITAKTLLLAAAIAIAVPVALWTGVLREYFWLVIASGLQLVAIVVSAAWLLQGLETMAKASFYGLLVRALTVPLTILLVRSPSDVAIAAAIQSLGALAASAITLVYAHRLSGVFRAPAFRIASGLRELRKSSLMFVSMGSVSLFTYANVVVLGAMSGMVQVALFNGADRIKRAAQALLGPLSAAFYPRINHLMAKNAAHAKKAMYTLLVVQFSAGLILAAGIAIFAPVIVQILLGPEFTAAVPILQVQCGVIVLGAISNSLGTNMMLPMGLKSTYTVILVFSGLLNVGLLFLLIPGGGAMGASLAVLTTEVVIALSKATVIYRHRTRLDQVTGP